MPQIPGYEEHIQAVGQLGVRATPNDFGAQVGEGMQRVGAGLQDVGQAVYDYKAAKEATQASMDVIQARKDLTANLDKLRTEAQPGTDDFVQRFDQSTQEYANSLASKYVTAKGRDRFSVAMQSVRAEFFERAIQAQASLDAKEARVQFDAMHKNAGEVAYNDPTQAQKLLEDGHAVINGDGIFKRIDQATRNEMLQAYSREVAFSTFKGIVRREPDRLLGLVSPDQMAQFSAYSNLLNSFAAPGAKVKLAPQVMAKAPEIARAAAESNVPPNLLAAKVEVSKAEDIKQSATDLLMAMNKTGGDATKAVAVTLGATPEQIRSGEQLYGEDWKNALPAQMQAALGLIVDKAGLQPPADASAVQGQGEPKAGQPTSIPQLPMWSALSWEQQDNLINEGVRLQHLRMTMAEKARSEEEYAKAKAQESRMKELTQQIFSPKKFGRFDQEAVAADPILTSTQAQHMIGVYERRQRELRADQESRTNPAEFRRLELQIRDGNVYDTTNALESYRQGRISSGELSRLEVIAAQLKDSSTNNFQKQFGRLISTANEAYTKDFKATLPGMMPVYAAAAYAFQRDAEEQVAEYRKQGKDPRELLDPKSRSYLLAPERVQAFMPKGSDLLAQGAAAVPVSGGGLPTWESYDKLKSGDQFVDKQGNIRRKP